MNARSIAPCLSRRAWLRRIAAAGALAVTADPRLGRVAAQEGTPATVPPLLADWAAAWSSADPARVTTLYAADADLEDVTAGTIYRGRDAIIARIADIAAGFPDHTDAIDVGFVAGDQAAAEYRFDGTYTGSMPGLPVGAGQQVSVRGAVLLEAEGGQIVRERQYYDAYGFLIQLGVLPAPGAPPATPSPETARPKIGRGV